MTGIRPAACALALAGAIVSAATLSAQEPAASVPSAVAVAPTGYQGAKIKRWSPLVVNLDHAIHLYRDILGFELDSVTEESSDSYVFEIFGLKPGARLRHAVFNAGPEKRVLSVVEVPGLASPRKKEKPRMSALLVNANGNFDRIAAALKAESFRMFAPHRLGENGIEMGFVDENGHTYALYEIPYWGRALDK